MLLNKDYKMFVKADPLTKMKFARSHCRDCIVLPVGGTSSSTFNSKRAFPCADYLYRTNLGVLINGRLI